MVGGLLVTGLKDHWFQGLLVWKQDHRSSEKQERRLLTKAAIFVQLWWMQRLFCHCIG